MSVSSSLVNVSKRLFSISFKVERDETRWEALEHLLILFVCFSCIFKDKKKKKKKIYINRDMVNIDYAFLIFHSCTLNWNYYFVMIIIIIKEKIENIFKTL